MGTIASDVTVPAAEFSKAYEDFAKLGDVPAKAADEITAEEIDAHVKKIIASVVFSEIASDPAKYDTGNPDAIANALMAVDYPKAVADTFEVALMVGPSVTVSLLGGAVADLDGTEGKQARFDDGTVLTIKTANKSLLKFAYGGISGLIDPPISKGLTFTVHEPFELAPRYCQAVLGVPYAPNEITAADVTEVLKG